MLAALEQFDEIFAVLKDDDLQKMDRVRAWARPDGKPGVSEASARITDDEVNRLIEERNAAKRARDFARADAIRKQLTDAGIIVEDTKDGIRWKRK